MSIGEDIEGTVVKHPVYWGLGIVAVVGLAYLYYSSGSKSSGQTSNFTYSIGPTDAQIAAGTQQQIASQADQTAVSLANIQAATNTSEAGDYFSYLTTNSANALTGTLSNNATALAQTQSNNATSLGVNAQTIAGDENLAAQGYAYGTATNSTISTLWNELTTKNQQLLNVDNAINAPANTGSGQSYSSAIQNADELLQQYSILQ